VKEKKDKKKKEEMYKIKENQIRFTTKKTLFFFFFFFFLLLLSHCILQSSCRNFEPKTSNSRIQEKRENRAEQIYDPSWYLIYLTDAVNKISKEEAR